MKINNVYMKLNAVDVGILTVALEHYQEEVDYENPTEEDEKYKESVDDLFKEFDVIDNLMRKEDEDV